MNPPSIKGHIYATTVAAAMIAIDNLKALLGQGEVRIRTAYAPDRYCLGLCETFDGDGFKAEVLNGVVNVTLLFTIPEGVARRLNPDGYALSTARTACPIGTAPCAPTIIVHGGGSTLTNPTVTIRNAAGDIVQTAAFTVALGANDFLRIDCGRALVSRSTAGVITDALAAGLWTSGDYSLLLRPYDGWVESSAWPTVELSASGGTPVGEITYVRRYL